MLQTLYAHEEKRGVLLDGTVSTSTPPPPASKNWQRSPEEELFNSVFRFSTADVKEEDIRQLNAVQIFEAMKQAHPAAMRGITAYSLSRVLPQLGERIHAMKGNVYREAEEMLHF